jgi:aminoglycoside phosphotransferase (APT) family kinase protein
VGTLAADVVAWVERAIGPGARVVGVTRLPPSSTEKDLIEVARADGATVRVVLRRYHDRERLAEDPWYVPAHEAAALELLAGSVVPAPRLHAADLDATICDVPALLESWLPGAPAWRPADVDRYLVRTAETLVAIHAVRVAAAGVPAYAPYYPPSSERWSSVARSDPWTRVGTVLDRPWPPYRPTFIHRDYHPGNVLWDGTAVTGVVDWATAAIGPPGIDLARMRQNLASHLGADVAGRFTQAYVAAGGDPSARDPFWDLLDAADSLPDLAPHDGPGGGDRGRFEDYVARVVAEV